MADNNGKEELAIVVTDNAEESPMPSYLRQPKLQQLQASPVSSRTSSRFTVDTVEDHDEKSDDGADRKISVVAMLAVNPQIHSRRSCPDTQHLCSAAEHARAASLDDSTNSAIKRLNDSREGRLTKRSNEAKGSHRLRLGLLTSPSKSRTLPSDAGKSELPMLDDLAAFNAKNRGSLTSATSPGSDSRPTSSLLSINFPMAKRFASFFNPSDNSACLTPQIVVENGDEAADGQFSFGYEQTMDRIPHIDYYRNAISIKRQLDARPTLSDLLGDNVVSVDAESGFGSQEQESPPLEASPVTTFQLQTSVTRNSPSSKFGWIRGVLIRCFLNILGLMLFLRLSWITGQAGVGQATLIILLSTTVSVLTCLSMCAICTNGEVKGGGVYFLISRSLGPEFGGSIGIIFSIANAVAVGLHVLGFAEALRDIVIDKQDIITDPTNANRFIGAVALLVILIICLVGLEFEAIMQVGLLVILMAAIVNYVVGASLPPSDEKQAMGITGFSGRTLEANFWSDYRGEDFISLFAIFFPSVTGIAAGANISGDLKDPQTAIPKGTLLAILLTDIIYILFVWISGSTVVRDASGNATDLTNPNAYCRTATQPTNCTYGLMNYYQVMEMQSGFGPIITAGIFAATLSSALACLVSAPKIFQAVCNDKIYPKIHVFAKPYGKNGEPRRSYILAFIIAVGIIGIGDINIVAKIISNFYLASYALINYACFNAVYSNSPGFRPSFRYFNKWLALLGALLCSAAMVVMQWYIAVVTILLIGILYFYIRRRKPDINWGSSTQANTYKEALKLMQRLQQTPEHIKTYRPQILVLTGNPTHRPLLVDFVSSITMNTSLMICGHVLLTAQDVVKQNAANLVAMIRNFRELVLTWFRKRRVRSFYSAVVSCNIREGVHTLVQTSGLGRMRPNVIVLGFKNNWIDCSLEEINEYYNIIVDAFSGNMAVCLLRLPFGLDFGDLMEALHVGETAGQESVAFTDDSLRRCGTLGTLDSTDYWAKPDDTPAGTLAYQTRLFTVPTKASSSRHRKLHRKRQRLMRKIFPCSRHAGVSASAKSSVAVQVDLGELRNRRSSGDLLDKQEDYQQSQFGVIAAMNRFKRRISNAVIDVWWLFDDGGLTLLIPYLLAMNDNSFLRGARLRVFSLATCRNSIAEDQKRLTMLLQKFRILAADVEVITDIGKPPQLDSAQEFEQLISRFVIPDEGVANDPDPGMLTKEELAKMKDKDTACAEKELLFEYALPSLA